MNTQSKFYLIFAFLILLILYSCGSSSAYYYILTPANDYQPNDKNTESEISIGISSLEFPDYLRKPQIVTYKKDNEIYFDEFNRWAEPLYENFSRVVLENLSEMIPTNRIYMYMWPEEKKDILQIVLKINRFGLMQDSSVVLDARWSVSPINKRLFLTTKKSGYREKLKNTEYKQVVAAMSELTGKLCREIAADVRSKINN